MSDAGAERRDSLCPRRFIPPYSAAWGSPYMVLQQWNAL